MIHVLVVSNHWGVTDKKTFAGHFVDRQVYALRDLGVQVSTFDIGTSYSPLSLTKSWLGLRKKARDLNVDIVHARYGTVVALLSVFSGKPTLITFGGSDLLPGASVSQTRTYIGIFLSNFAAVFANAIICVSEEMRQAMWWRKKQVFVVPDGVNLVVFKPGSQIEARKKLGWDENRPIAIINAARDPINKGLPLALEAMELVKRQLSNAELKVIQGINPDEMPLCYQAADVLISASRQEGSANVIKEALACNLPVISSPVGDASERLARVSPSAVVPRDSSLMSEALIEILTLRQRCNGREHVLDLSLEIIAQKVNEIYLSIIKNERKAPTR